MNKPSNRFWIGVIVLIMLIVLYVCARTGVLFAISTWFGA